MSYDYNIERILLGQFPKECHRLCVRSGPYSGIEVGDKCIEWEGMYVPVIRQFAEGGIQRDFNTIPIEEAEGYEFVKL